MLGTEMRGQLIQMLAFDVVKRAADGAFQMKMCMAGIAEPACVLIAGAFTRCNGKAAYHARFDELFKSTVNSRLSDGDSVRAQCITQLLCGQMGMRMRFEILQDCRTLFGTVFTDPAHFPLTSMSTTSHSVSRFFERTIKLDPLPM